MATQGGIYYPYAKVAGKPIRVRNKTVNDGGDSRWPRTC